MSTATTGHRKPGVASASLATRPLTLLSPGGAELGAATGFLIDAGGRLGLVSNWHVFAGRSVYGDLAPIHESCATPVRVRIDMWESFPVKAVEVDLVDESDRGTWFEHPALRHRIDIGVLPLGSSFADYPDQLLDDCLIPLGPGPITPILSVTSDVSIVGYPKRLVGPAVTPIWSRATVASEPDLDQGGLPRFLVDARTTSGQSGSPVVLFSATFVDYIDNQSGDRMAVGHMGGPLLVPIGVYSGRNTESEQDFGFVWRYPLVREIVVGASRYVEP